MTYPPHHDRSPLWAAARDAWLADHPACAYCGRTAPTILNVHHILPFHIFPGEELNTGNFITLCEQEPYYCHLAIGHLGDWLAWNPVLLDPDTPAHAGYITFLQARPLLSSLGGSGSTPLPLLSNTVEVDIAGADGRQSLLNIGDSFDIPEALKGVGRTIFIDAYGEFIDPEGNVPNASFQLLVNSISLGTVTQQVTSSRWHLQAQLTIRNLDVSGHIGVGLSVTHDNPAGGPFLTQQGVLDLDTTDTLHIYLAASIDNVTDGEHIKSNALTIYVA